MLATLSLSFSISLPVILVTGILYANICNEYLNKWEMLFIIFIIIIAHYLCLNRTGRSIQIVKEQPEIINKKISIILTVMFFAITTSILFYGPDIIKGLVK